jgi:hypothetical protein
MKLSLKWSGTRTIRQQFRAQNQARLGKAKMPNVPGIKKALRAKDLAYCSPPGDLVTSLFLTKSCAFRAWATIRLVVLPRRPSGHIKQ